MSERAGQAAAGSSGGTGGGASSSDRGAALGRGLARADRLGLLNEATTLLVTAESVDEAVNAFVERAIVALGASGAALALVDVEAEELDFVALLGESRFADTMPRRLSLTSPAAVCVAVVERRPIWLGSPAQWRREFPHATRLLEVGGLSTLALPLIGRSGPVGVLGFVFDRPDALDEEERELAASFAVNAAQAMERTRAAQFDHEVAVTLQRSLLAAPAPTVGSMRIASFYQPAARGLEVGGDWFDVFGRDDGETVVAIGDVVGKGLHAAAAVGQLRALLRVAAHEADGPADVVTRIERAIDVVPSARYSSLAVVMIDTAGRARYCSAGHPPFVVVPGDAAGGARLVEGTRSAVLGVDPAHVARTDESFDLPPGCALVLYTDGLVETRTEPIDAGIEQLVDSLGRARRSPEDLLAAALGPTLRRVLRDDVAVLVVKRMREPLRVRFPAQRMQLSGIRHRLRGVLLEEHLPPDRVEELVVAAGEALTNAVEHAYGDRLFGHVDLVVFADEGEVTLRVSDNGRWRTPGDRAGRGMGTPIMRSLADSFRIVRTDSGTSVTMTARR